MNIDKVLFDFLITEDMKALNINTNHHKGPNKLPATVLTNHVQTYWMNFDIQQIILKISEKQAGLCSKSC